jgi:Leucine-rich repeat (LRR) protein
MTRDEAVRRIERVVEQKLIKLDLSGLELEELPAEIAKCTHLTRLNLNKNQITSIPKAFGLMSNLEWLDLSDNQLTSIPEGFGLMSNLEWLNLNNNQITSIPEAIGQMSSLRELWLSCNQITSIPQAIGQLSNLIGLDLSNNQITLIPENQLRQLSNLKLTWVNISNNPIINFYVNQISSRFPTSIGHLQKLKIGGYKDGTYSHHAYQIPPPINLLPPP